MPRPAPPLGTPIERVAAPAPADLDRRYLRTGTPVVLTGLYDRAPAAELRDPAVARRVLGALPLRVTPPPISELLERRRTSPPRATTVARFVADLDGGSREVCVELETPTALATRLRLPYLTLGAVHDRWVSLTYLAGPGSTTHLHFDRDLRHNVMVQVFGRKRYVVVDAAHSRKLQPGVGPAAPYASGLYLEHFSPADLSDFLRYTRAWDVVLEPGEALLIPATAWHWVSYLDVALSVGFRLRRNRWLAALADAVPVPSPELQALGTVFRDEDAVPPPAREAFAAVLAAAHRPHSGDAARTAAVDAACVVACRRLGLPIADRPYDVVERDRRAEMVPPPPCRAQLMHPLEGRFRGSGTLDRL
jgi:hypothetical protein